jgi:phosphoribosylamine--glycine ligase
MKVLVIGGGGREHALCWKIARSPLVGEVVCAPGNAGTALVARNVSVRTGDAAGLTALAKKERADLVVIGPEDPLCAGLADRMRAEGLRVFGPGARGARLEGSKVFAKEMLDKHRIPTAPWRMFDRSGLAKGYLEGAGTWPLVIKADGLAAGKGVYICEDVRSGCAAVDAIMEERRHGEAGERIVVEEFVPGEEASVFAITDGNALLILEPVQDHKRLGEGDTGPNTGGMGVFSPVPIMNRRLHKQVEQRVLLPTAHAMRQEGIEFRGVLFLGLMLTESGPRVLEYNVRFGDPECEALMRRMKSDLVPYLVATADGKLEECEPPEWDSRHCVGVVMASAGYPGETVKGEIVRGLSAAAEVESVEIFHAGTRASGPDVLTNGGRVLCVTAMGATLDEARTRAHQACELVDWDGKYYRRDIGRRNERRKADEATADPGGR